LTSFGFRAMHRAPRCRPVPFSRAQRIGHHPAHADKPVIMRLVLLVLLLSVSSAASSRADIYRCIGEGDVPVFSDRTCNELGLSERKAEEDLPAPLVLPSVPSTPFDCPRQVDVLKDGVRVALETGDLNQLAGLYLWTDIPTDAADMLMSELEAISSRRLAMIDVESHEVDGHAQPSKLWLTQYRAADPGRSIRTSFSLVTNAGCWWLHR